MRVRSTQRGNAMVEFVLVPTALTPMFLLTPMLAKTADANLATAQAARYGAWEQTIQHKDSDKLAVEINSRFYARPDMAIRTSRGVVTSTDLHNPFWAGAGLDGNLVNKKGNPLSVAVNESSLGGKASVVEKVVNTLGNTIGAIVPDSEWNLGGGGIYTVNVGLNISNARLTAEDGQEKNCQSNDRENSTCMRQQSAILVDTWGARGPKQVIRRVRSLLPAGALQPLGDTVAIAGKVLPMFQELKKLDEVFGEVKPDILPPDRYGKE